MSFLAVKNFEEYQHYKDRSPPWIKLYNSLLDDYAFLRLSEQSQIHLVKLWLLASRHDNRIPHDLAYISGKIQPKSAIDIEELILSGFLYATDLPAKRKAKKKARKPRSDKGIQRKHDASTMLAPRKQDACLEKSREEGEGEGEKNYNTTSPATVVAVPKPKKPVRWPNFPDAACRRLYTAWSKLGAPSYPVFRNAFGRLFPEVPKYTVEQLERAIAECIEDASTTGRGEFVTPSGFVDRAQYWIDKSTPIAQRDPARAFALGVVA
jgi:hypothetical protein